MTVDLGVCLNQHGRFAASGWSVDSRSLVPGDVFFALRGPSHDGHDHVSGAFRAGAAAAVVDHPVEAVGPLFVVEDTLGALQRTAAMARRTWGGALVAVTGSAGKTSTKEAIAALLSAELPAGRSEGNLNNHVGVPLSLLRLPDGCRVAVIEIGMNHAGEIRDLAAIARPNVGVVTNVGSAHIEYFGSIEGIAQAKRELIEALPREGIAVLNADDPYVASFAAVHSGWSLTFGLGESAAVRARDVSYEAAGASFTVDGVRFSVPQTGAHAVRNVLAGIAVARAFGIPTARLVEPACRIEAPAMRGRRLDLGGITIFDDCYNANPEATRAMVDVLAAAPARRRAAVLGEMLELGPLAEALHRGIGSYVAERGIDVLIGIRGAARHMVDEAVRAGMSGAAYFFDDPETAGDFARAWLAPGDAALFKGSRGVRVERALDRLLAVQEERV